MIIRFLYVLYISGVNVKSMINLRKPHSMSHDLRYLGVDEKLSFL